MSGQTGGGEAEPQRSKYQNRQLAAEGDRLRLRQSLAVPVLSSKLLVHLRSMAFMRIPLLESPYETSPACVWQLSEDVFDLPRQAEYT